MRSNHATGNKIFFGRVGSQATLQALCRTTLNFEHFLVETTTKKQTNGTADKLEILGHYPDTEFLKVKDKGKSAY